MNSRELVVRKCTITEFFLAHVNSNTENIQANLCYLDYTRLKKEEERKKRAAAAKKLESLLPDLRAERPLPELSLDDVSTLQHAVLDGVDPLVRDRLKEAISSAEARFAEEAKRQPQEEHGEG